MMDGLECSEVNLSDTTSNKDFRIDSAFYTTKIYRNPELNYTPIGDCLLKSQYGMSIDMNDTGDGYQIFRMNEIHNMLCDLSTAKYVNVPEVEFSKFKLENEDVLFNRTNSYELVGRTGIYYATDISQTYASYLVKLVPDKSKIIPEYLAAFLNSSYGAADVKRRSRQSINQTNVNPEEVKEILIPLLNANTQDKIAKSFTSAHKLRLRAQASYEQAEQLLLSALGLTAFAASEHSISLKLLSASFSVSGRLDAEYYQPKYDDYTSMIKTSYMVSTLCKVHDKNYTPKAGTEYKYIELSNVGVTGNICDFEVVDGKDLPSRARRKVKSGQIIVASIEGSLQSCALITDEYNNAICSTGFYVLDSDSINSETLLVLFKSKPIQALLKQRCTGTILTAISKDELFTIPLPLIDEAVQKQIASKVQETFALRRQSEQLLENAKSAVEIAIEQGEKKAMEWLKERGAEG